MSRRLWAGAVLLLFSGCTFSDLRSMAPVPENAADPIQARFKRADELFSEGRAADAVMELRAAERLLAPEDPRLIEEKVRVGMAFLAEREIGPAQEAFLSAIQSAHDLGLVNEHVADAYAGIGLALAEMNRFHRACEYLQRGLALGPHPDVKRRAQKALDAALARAREDVEPSAYGPGFVVRRIVLSGGWTEESVLRRRIPFKEGDSITGRQLQEAREAFYRMNQFKRVEVSTKEFEGGAEVDISLRDGWYLIPFPALSFGAGGGRGGGLIEGRNLFNHAEDFTLAVLSGPDGSRVALGGEAEGWSGRIVSETHGYVERLYADGAYSAVYGLGKPADETDIARFPAVADSYLKTTNDFIMGVEGPIGGRWSGEAGFDRSTVGYSQANPSVPSDSGKQGNAFLGVKYGSREFAPPGLGAILGYGLAGLDERLKPMPRPAFSQTGSARFIQGGRATKSGRFYGEGLAFWRGAYSWGNHQSVSLSLAGGHGATLPDSKLIATGRATGLAGQYAREFRGPTAAGVSLGYDRRLYASRVGLWQAGVFIEEGRAWYHGTAGDKQGVGVTMFLRFWRFPLPFGATYTWCFDDRQGVVSGAIGGRF